MKEKGIEGSATQDRPFNERQLSSQENRITEYFEREISPILYNLNS